MALTPAANRLANPSEPLPPTPLATKARVLVGPEKKEFVVGRGLLAAASPSFAEGLDASSERNKGYHTPCIWLAHEAPAMFELFVVWLHHRPSFLRVLDNALATNPDKPVPAPRACTSVTSLTRNGASGNPDADSHAAQKLHWGLVRLHLFAARLSLLQLQDTAMDALQDLYLRRAWDVTPRLIRFLYGKRAEGGLRLRRWAVAMVAWQLAGACPAEYQSLVVAPLQVRSRAAPAGPLLPGRMADLFVRHPQFTADYETHLRIMESSRLDVCLKNPQLRTRANRLCSEERMFAFRQCSFHSHRAAVGERPCTHANEGAGATAPGATSPACAVALPVVLEVESEQPKLGRVVMPDPRVSRSVAAPSMGVLMSGGKHVWV